MFTVGFLHKFETVLKIEYMKGKLLKFELFFYFLLVSFSLVFYYTQGALPDHMYEISSRSEQVNPLTYYLISMISLVGSVIGPWLLLPFACFIFAYTVQLSKRESVIDLFFIILLTGFFVGLGHLFFPKYLGQGLESFINKEVGTGATILISFACLILAYASYFRGRIKESVVNMRGNLQSSIQEGVKKLDPRVAVERLKERRPDKEQFIEWKNRLKLSVTRRLKGEKKVTPKVPPVFSAQIDDKKEPAEEENKNQLEFSQEGEVEQESSEQVASEPVAEPSVNSPLDRIRNRLKRNSPPEVQKSAPTKSFRPKFESRLSEFINCLKVSKVRRNKVRTPSDEYFDKIVSRLEEKLIEFKVDAQVINIIKGPVVDTFELELGAGIKVSRVTSITEDLSLALLGVPIRMVYPMKGKTTVGVEIPRSPREIIYLDEVLDSDDYRQTEKKLPIIMGKDAYGEVAITDLASMPHMLVAGVTGSGKSVFINALLTSLLIKLPPEKLRLILIDPKQLELALYARVPHLMLPVMTDSKEASLALLWASQEMERRYSILKELGVRNIDGYNLKLKTSSEDEIEGLKKFFPAGTKNFKLPFLVVVIDEFADLILTKAGKEIENNVCRLAAKARAAGIHLVVATQRPSVDVITGLIKSNFPTRISFRVTSNVDSRTILNTIGSEKLLGKGDMLFKHGIEMSRLHSAFVDEGEIEHLMESLCTEDPEFNEEAVAFMENEGGMGSDSGPGGRAGGGERDELYDEAVNVVVDYGMASASMLQRRLKIGYNRAANLIDQLESNEVIGPQEGPKPRKVLISGR